MSRRKKSGGDGGGGGANWMDTYGDLVTLLLCFFVMLFASSTISEEKWRDIVASFRGDPTGSVIEPIDPQYPTQGFTDADRIQERYEETDGEDRQKSEAQQEIEVQFNNLFEELQEYVEEENLQQTVLLNQEGLYILITILDGILFDSGQAVIRDEVAEDALRNIAILMSEYIGSIQNITVEGHTDNVPISTAQFTDNLDLSSMRANNVARFLSVEGLIDMKMFDSLGRSEWHPIASNETEEGKQMNRRVEILLLAKNLDEENPSIADVEKTTLVENRPQIVTSDEVQVSDGAVEAVSVE